MFGWKLIPKERALLRAERISCSEAAIGKRELRRNLRSISAAALMGGRSCSMTQKRSRGDVIYLIGMRRVFWRDGAAALPTMLVISSVIMEIAIAGAVLAFVFVRSGLAARINAEAVTVARAGGPGPPLRPGRG